MSVSIAHRMPPVNMIERTISKSGKYMIFLGTHFEKGHTCWVVGSSNKVTGEIIMRHYNDTIKDCVAPRALAYQYWETFKQHMTENVHGHEEEPTYLEGIKKHLERPH